MKHAFSLVELSIVLVILGLLVGGILAGQSLIRAAELRAVSTEYSRYVTAVKSFRDKYFALPGDMTNATRLRETAAGSGSDATCYDTVQITTATCNGNGDGEIYAGSWNGTGESFLIWKHLANAGLMDGAFPGTTATNGGYTSPYAISTAIMPGWNIPSSKLSRAIWISNNVGNANVSLQKYYGSYTTSAAPYYSNSLLLADKAIDPLGSLGGPLNVQEAWNIDSKLDDGRPGSGRVEALRGNSNSPGSAGNCLTSADPALADYDLADTTGGSCAIVFVAAFR